RTASGRRRTGSAPRGPLARSPRARTLERAVARLDYALEAEAPRRAGTSAIETRMRKRRVWALLAGAGLLVVLLVLAVSGGADERRTPPLEAARGAAAKD